ncbi:ComEC family competence protein [Euzebyella marina]|uniref:ComEC family competence protein n=1 Tax=Euzebyella marina TaxID=1761453 RepID=A0A3G2LA69_9FLAO|nr:ComEC/Rec2 family competence protein [Euzebyella marina]AYN69147.1 ComEC family competence protein [Euzebyella marina]
MRLLRSVPIKLTLFLIIGILLGEYFNLPTEGATTVTFVFLVLTALLFKPEKNSIFFGIGMAFTTIGIGALAIALNHRENRPNHYSKYVSKSDNNYQLKIVEEMKPTAFSYRYLAKVIAVNQTPSSGKILLSGPKDSVHLLNVDDELVAFGKERKIPSPLNPHQFDYSKYMYSHGISDQLTLSDGNYILKTNSSKTIYGLASHIRNTIITNLKAAHFGSDELSIIQALLLGQRADISEDTYSNYKDAGAVHILAVSGLHIGILLLILQFILRPLERFRKGKTVKTILIILLLWGFALLAGFSASVVRAVTMFSFLAYAQHLNRPSNNFNILALSMFAILLVINPRLLFQVGFQMSYAAVFSIIWIYPLLQKLYHPKNKILRYFWQLLSVSIAAQLGVLPVSLYYFHQFPSLFFISNLVIVPLLGVILALGIVVIILANIQLLPNWLITIYDHIIKYMNLIVEWVAQQEEFIFRDIPFGLAQLILAYLCIITFILFLTRPTFKKVLPFAFVLICFQSWMIYNKIQLKQKEVLFLAHQTKNTLLVHHLGNQLTILSKDSLYEKRLVNTYKVAEHIDEVKPKLLKNTYQWKDQHLFFIDSTGVKPPHKKSSDYLILTQSPKINLNRLIDSIKPHIIIADGSNYRSYVNQWKATCRKRKIPFYYTGEKGAYFFGHSN